MPAAAEEAGPTRTREPNRGRLIASVTATANVEQAMSACMPENAPADALRSWGDGRRRAGRRERHDQLPSLSQARPFQLSVRLTSQLAAAGKVAAAKRERQFSPFRSEIARLEGTEREDERHLQRLTGARRRR